MARVGDAMTSRVAAAADAIEKSEGSIGCSCIFPLLIHSSW